MALAFALGILVGAVAGPDQAVAVEQRDADAGPVGQALDVFLLHVRSERNESGERDDLDAASAALRAKSAMRSIDERKGARRGDGIAAPLGERLDLGEARVDRLRLGVGIDDRVGADERRRALGELGRRGLRPKSRRRNRGGRARRSRR